MALATMLDFAVTDLHFTVKNFFDLFISSGYAHRLGNGHVDVIAGKSGVEIAFAVLSASGYDRPEVDPTWSYDKTSIFWTGWALAYYQWYTGQEFEDIVKEISIDEIHALYHPFHEMDITQFVDVMERIRERNRRRESNIAVTEIL